MNWEIKSRQLNRILVSIIATATLANWAAAVHAIQPPSVSANEIRFASTN